MKKTILLQAIGRFDQRKVLKLKKNLEWTFKGLILKVIISKRPFPLLYSFYNSVQKQYDVHPILKNLKVMHSHKQYICVLGLTEDDIYSKTRNFIFGIAEKAYLNFPGFAVISTCRLDETFYNRETDHILLESRTLKEAVHEIGHVLGLIHCNHDCVMQFSESLRNIDQKSLAFCKSCFTTIKRFFLEFRDKEDSFTKIS